MSNNLKPTGKSATAAASAVALRPASAQSEADLRQIIAQSHEAARASSTRARYARVWRQFQQFCFQADKCALPADADTILLFLAWYGTTRVTPTLRQARAGIRHYHAEAGHLDMTTQPSIAKFLAGHQRLTGRPPIRKQPLLTDDVREVSRSLDVEGGAAALRDRAMILLAYACALRASEAVAATWQDCEISNRGVTLTIPRSKTDQAGHGQSVTMVRTTNLATCPVAALEEWREFLEQGDMYDERAPIFCALRRVGGQGCREYVVEKRPVTTSTYRVMLKQRCSALGIKPSCIGGHSLRAGHATQAAENGVDVLEIAQQGRWRDLRKVQVYVRSARRFSYNSSAKIGL